MCISKFKQQAKLIKNRSKEMEVKLSHQQSLELIAALNGFKTWNALEASQKEEPKEDIKKEFSYWRLDYFYDRKNSGSFYVKINNKELEETVKLTYDDETAVIEIANATNQIDKSDVRSISFAEEISEEDYNEAREV